MRKGGPQWALAVVLFALAACSGTPAPSPETACHTGAWHFADGEILVLTPVDDGLRYRFVDGRTGRLEPGEGGELQAREGWRTSGPFVA